MAVQIEGMGGLLAARTRRRRGGDGIERQVDDAVAGTERVTLMRYFLCRGLGPLAMTPLPVGASPPTRARLHETPARLPERVTTGLLPAPLSAVSLAPVASGTDKEYLATARQGTDDESNGQHGRAAREVGRRAAGMRWCSAITAA
jgi:hypothetical protein